jgi:hypothetical protein
MKRTSTLIACAALLFAAILSAHATLRGWYPAERPHSGPTGSGEHSVVDGMTIYQTPPSKPYVVIGTLRVGSLMSLSVRKAAKEAKEIHADALIYVGSEHVMTAYDGNMPGYQGGGFYAMPLQLNRLTYKVIKWVKKNGR